MTEIVETIINDARSMVMTANHGLDLIRSQSPDYLPTGVRNVLTFGREVTRVLQRLRSHVDNFDEWYSPYKEEMEKDSLMKFLYNLRNDVLKEGKMPVSSTAYIDYLNGTMVRRLPKPPNAKGFFFGDKLGGSGWEIQLPDGSIQKFYIKLPWDSVKVSTYFNKMPSTHLGRNISGMTIEQACRLYLQYLKNLVDDANTTFHITK